MRRVPRVHQHQDGRQNRRELDRDADLGDSHGEGHGRHERVHDEAISPEHAATAANTQTLHLPVIRSSGSLPHVVV